MYRETPVRSVLKALSWRVLGTLVTATVVLIMTRKPWVALAAGGADFFSKIGLYFIHERVWNRVRIGKRAYEPVVVWLTGLSAAGKTTIARELVKRMKKLGLTVEHLDGDSIRDVFPQTGFTREARVEHIKRVGFLASRLERNNVFVVASFISPYQESRDFVRSLCPNFLEVYVSTPIAECEKRDPKGLYSKARQGTVKNFTGVDDPYEAPTHPDLVIDTSVFSAEDSASLILKRIRKEQAENEFPLVHAPI
jgi:adenylylsulfate kinase